MSIFSKPEAHDERCSLAAMAIEVNDFDQALIYLEQARTALHPEGVESTTRCEYLAALCFFGMHDLPQAKERLTEAWKLSPISSALDEGGITNAEDDELIQRLLDLTKRIKKTSEEGGFSETEPMSALAAVKGSATLEQPETLVMNFNEAVEAIKACSATTADQLRAVRDAISFALSDDSAQLDSEAVKRLAKGLLGYCDWRLDHRPTEGLSELILERRALRRLEDIDFEEILVDCILETPLTWLQRCRYKLRLVDIEYDRSGLRGLLGWPV